MILAILTIGGTLLGASTIAGLLMIYQIRQSSDATNSVRAIFAADAALEWGLYQFLGPGLAAPPTMANGTTYTLNCYDGTTNPPDPTLCTSTSTTIMRTVGSSGNSNRAFELSF